MHKEENVPRCGKLQYYTLTGIEVFGCIARLKCLFAAAKKRLCLAAVHAVDIPGGRQSEQHPLFGRGDKMIDYRKQSGRCSERVGDL